MEALLIARITDFQQVTISCWNLQFCLNAGQVGVHALSEVSDLAQQGPAYVKHKSDLHADLSGHPLQVVRALLLDNGGRWRSQTWL